MDDSAGLAWIVNLGCIELHPHPVRSGDLDHPDELRIDLDPGPGVSWTDVRRVSLEVKSLLEEAGLRGWPKTSGSRGMHVIVRIQPRWGFWRSAPCCAGALARDRAPPSSDRQFEMVEGRAARRISRLQPECEGSYDRVRIFRAPAARCARVCAAQLAGGERVRPSGFHHSYHAEALCRDRRSACGYGRIAQVHSTGYWSLRVGMRRRVWLMLHGRRTFARQKAKRRVCHLRAQNLLRRSLARTPRSKMPLLVVANSPNEDAALAGSGAMEEKISGSGQPSGRR